MDKETFVKEWVADLRSGKFKQGEGQLVTPEGSYCCLGVACETAVRLGIQDNGADMQGQESYPDDWFYNLLGLPLSYQHADCHVLYEGLKTTLTDLNDGGVLSFADIANVIEENYLND